MNQRTVERFNLFDSSIISDTLDDFDVDGVITGILPADPEHVAIGLATTVEFAPARTENEPTNFPYAMLEAFEPNRIMVIDGVSPEVSCWGGRASQLAENAGLEGVVIDGGYRDVDSIRTGTFPVFGRQSTPRTGQHRVRVAAVNESISIDSVTVSPGDLVIADATGVVVVPMDIVDAVLEEAEHLLARELLLEAKIENGAPVAELKKANHQF